MDERRVLITGGAGFIGSELARQSARLGHTVIIVDNLVNGKKANVEDILVQGVQLEVCDIRDEQEMNRLLQKVDTVFHLACLGVRHSIHSPLDNHDVNATATLGLLAWSRNAGVKRFVYVSSSEVYGTAGQVPMTEVHPTFPNTVYGASKLAGECYARAYWATHRFPTVILRPFNTYGPRCHHEGDSGEVIPKFMLRAMTGKPMVVFGDGKQTRDFTFVEDTARGILEAANHDDIVGKTINLGQGGEISIIGLAQAVAESLDQSRVAVEYMEARPGDVLRLCADTTLARDSFGFSPTVSLQEGLTRLRKWYESQTESPEELLKQEQIRNWEFKASDVI